MADGLGGEAAEIRLLLARMGIAWSEAELALWQPVIDRYLAGLARLTALPVEGEPATGFAAGWEPAE